MTGVYTRKEIMEDIWQMLNKDFNVRDEITADKQKLLMTSFFFDLNAIQLYQILMAIEEKYNIYFSASEIEENGFGTVDEIVRLIQLKL